MVRYDPRRHRRVLQAGHRLWHAWIGIGWRAAPLSRGGDADEWRKRRVEAVGRSPVPNSRGDLMSARDALVDRRGAFARSDVGQRRRVAAVQCRLLVRRRRARPINFRKNLVRGLNHRRGPRRAKAAVGRSDMNGRIAPIDPVQRIEHRRVHDRGNAAGVLRRSAAYQGHAKRQLVPIGHDVRTRRRRQTEEPTNGQDPECFLSSNPWCFN